jgi:hypothetical protein
MVNVEGNIQTHHLALRMATPGEFLQSTVLKEDVRGRETHHHRANESTVFRIHHVFIPAN